MSDPPRWALVLAACLVLGRPSGVDAWPQTTPGGPDDPPTATPSRGILAGRLVTEDGRPLTAATVTLERLDTTNTGQITSSTGRVFPSGSFFFVNLEPGRYRIRASGKADGRSTESPPLSATHEVWVRADPIPSLVITLRPGGTPTAAGPGQGVAVAPAAPGADTVDTPVLAGAALAGVGARASGTPAGGAVDYTTARFERRLQAVRTARPIVVDGVLDEPAWKDAPRAANFVQNEPREGQPATDATEVWVLYDDVNLYFGVFNHDPEPHLAIVSELERDFNVVQGDIFGIVLDTFHDERNGYQFEANPAGAKWDAQCFNASRQINSNWDGVWSVATTIVEDGWYAEFAIPFRTVKFSSADPQTWGVNFLRRVRRRNEDSYWAPLPRIRRIHYVPLAGTLEELEGLRPGSNVRFKPYALGSSSTVGSEPNEGDADVGFDIKYGVTSGLTWDFTVNTDFSQVEADEQQVNLTRFSLFFPEKREFFLENAGVFQFGPANRRRGFGRLSGSGRQNLSRNDVILFFSRRIGLSDEGEAVPILAGTRLTGRVGSVALGALNVQQRSTDEVPATNFTTVRLRQDLFANSDLGVMVLNKEESGDGYNRVLGADANFRFFRNFDVNGFLAKSFSPLEVIGETGEDLTAQGGVRWQDAAWDARASYISIGERFNDEMGFVPRIGIDKIEVGVGPKIRPRATSGWLREISPTYQLIDIERRKDGQIDSRYIDYQILFTFQDGTFIEYGLNTNVENPDEPFTINHERDIAIAPGRYEFDEQFVEVRTNHSAPLWLTGRYSTGEFYDGHKRTYLIGATARVGLHLNLSGTLTRNDIEVSSGAFTTDLLAARINYNFSTTMFLNSLLQYNTDARQFSSNIRFNIIHRPLSDLFLVYNERRDSRSRDLLDRAVIAKFTYMMQF